MPLDLIPLLRKAILLSMHSQRLPQIKVIINLMPLDPQHQRYINSRHLPSMPLVERPRHSSQRIHLDKLQ